MNLDAATLRAKLDEMALVHFPAHIKPAGADDWQAGYRAAITTFRSWLAEAAAPRPVAEHHHYQPSPNDKNICGICGDGPWGIHRFQPPASECATCSTPDLCRGIGCQEAYIAKQSPPPPAEAREDETLAADYLAWTKGTNEIAALRQWQADALAYESQVPALEDEVAALRAQVQALQGAARADEARLRSAAERAGVLYVGCDTPEALAERADAAEAKLSDVWQRAIAVVEQMYAVPYGHTLYLERQKVLAALRAAQDGTA